MAKKIGTPVRFSDGQQNCEDYGENTVGIRVAIAVAAINFAPLTFINNRSPFMGKFILHVSGGCYTFSFHTASGDRIASSPAFITKSSAQQAVNETRIASERAHLYKKLESGGQYYFELSSEADQLLLVSERYWSEESRDYAVALVKRKCLHADYYETF